MLNMKNKFWIELTLIINKMIAQNNQVKILMNKDLLYHYN